MLHYFIKTDFFGYSYKKRLAVLAINIICALSAFFAGQIIDNHYKTKLWSLIMVIASFPISQILIYKFVFKKNRLVS